MDLDGYIEKSNSRLNWNLRLASARRGSNQRPSSTMSRTIRASHGSPLVIEGCLTKKEQEHGCANHPQNNQMNDCIALNGVSSAAIVD